MITSYRHDRKRTEKRRTLVIVVFGVLLVLFFFRAPFVGILKQVGGAVASPFWHTGGKLNVGWENLKAYFARKADLEEENAALHEEVQKLSLSGYQTALLVRENSEMKEMLGRKTNSTLLLAEILVKPSYSPYDTFIVDIGSAEGIAVGDKVFIERGFVIGEVATTYRHSALVSLYSSPGNEFQAYVGSSTIPVTAKGAGGGNFRASVPRGSEIAAGDPLILPAFGTAILATLDVVDVSENSSFATLYFKLPFNYLTLRHVYVEIPRVIPQE